MSEVSEQASAAQDLGKPTQPTAEDVRNALLRSMYKRAGVDHEGTASMIRNWATAYGILTDKVLAERSAPK